MIIFQTTKIERKSSRYGGIFYYLFFKCLTCGHSYRTCLGPKMRNYARWSEIVDGVKAEQTFALTNLIVKPGTRLIDADSMPQIVEGVAT